MTKTKRNLLIILVLAVVLLAGFIVFKLEYQKAELRRMEAEQDRIDNLEEELKQQQEQMRQTRLEELKEEKEKNAVDIIDFHEQYTTLWNDFSKEVKNISGNMIGGAVSLEEVKELTYQRIGVTEAFIKEFSKLEVPEVLGQFHDYQLEFLKNDYTAWSLTYAYYNSQHYSTYQTQEMDQLHQQNTQLFEKARAELIDVYDKYDLADLAQEIY